MRPSLVYISFLAACLSSGSSSTAQITRDVGDIAVIAGNNNIIFTPADSNGNNCAQVSVNIQELAKKFYQTHDDDYQMLVMFTNFTHLLSPGNTCSGSTQVVGGQVSVNRV